MDTFFRVGNHLFAADIDKPITKSIQEICNIFKPYHQDRWYAVSKNRGELSHACYASSFYTIMPGDELTIHLKPRVGDFIELSCQGKYDLVKSADWNGADHTWNINYGIHKSTIYHRIDARKRIEFGNRKITIREDDPKITFRIGNLVIIANNEKIECQFSELMQEIGCHFKRDCAFFEVKRDDFIYRHYQPFRGNFLFCDGDEVNIFLVPEVGDKYVKDGKIVVVKTVSAEMPNSSSSLRRPVQCFVNGENLVAFRWPDEKVIAQGEMIGEYKLGKIIWHETYGSFYSKDDNGCICHLKSIIEMNDRKPEKITVNYQRICVGDDVLCDGIIRKVKSVNANYCVVDHDGTVSGGPSEGFCKVYSREELDSYIGKKIKIRTDFLDNKRHIGRSDFLDAGKKGTVIAFCIYGGVGRLTVEIDGEVVHGFAPYDFVIPRSDGLEKGVKVYNISTDNVGRIARAVSGDAFVVGDLKKDRSEVYDSKLLLRIYDKEELVGYKPGTKVKLNNDLSNLNRYVPLVHGNSEKLDHELLKFAGQEVTIRNEYNLLFLPKNTATTGLIVSIDCGLEFWCFPHNFTICKDEPMATNGTADKSQTISERIVKITKCGDDWSGRIGRQVGECGNTVVVLNHGKSKNFLASEVQDYKYTVDELKAYLGTKVEIDSNTRDAIKPYVGKIGEVIDLADCFSYLALRVMVDGKSVILSPFEFDFRTGQGRKAVLQEVDRGVVPEFIKIGKPVVISETRKIGRVTAVVAGKVQVRIDEANSLTWYKHSGLIATTTDVELAEFPDGTEVIIDNLECCGLSDGTKYTGKTAMVIGTVFWPDVGKCLRIAIEDWLPEIYCFPHNLEIKIKDTLPKELPFGMSADKFKVGMEIQVDKESDRKKRRIVSTSESELVAELGDMQTKYRYDEIMPSYLKEDADKFVNKRLIVKNIHGMKIDSRSHLAEKLIGNSAEIDRSKPSVNNTINVIVSTKDEKIPVWCFPHNLEIVESIKLRTLFMDVEKFKLGNKVLIVRGTYKGQIVTIEKYEDAGSFKTTDGRAIKFLDTVPIYTQQNEFCVGKRVIIKNDHGMGLLNPNYVLPQETLCAKVVSWHVAYGCYCLYVSIEKTGQGVYCFPHNVPFSASQSLKIAKR